jgi:hypothetical protein
VEGKPPMPADPTAANSNDRCKLSLALTASVPANGECGRAVHTSGWSNPSLSSTRAIRHRVSEWPRDRTRNVAPSIFLLPVMAERTGS